MIIDLHLSLMVNKTITETIMGRQSLIDLLEEMSVLQCIARVL